LGSSSRIDTSGAGSKPRLGEFIIVVKGIGYHKIPEDSSERTRNRFSLKILTKGSSNRHIQMALVRLIWSLNNTNLFIMSLIDAGGGRLWCTVYPTRVNAFLYESWLYGISEAVTSLLALPSRDLL